MKATATIIAAMTALAATAQTRNVEVVQYRPAPGQFVNTMPEGAAGDSETLMCQRCTEQLADGNPVHLGAFGGYITVKFDHPIENKRGSDLRICGNAFYSTSDPVYGKATIGGSIEPGIVYVGVGDTPETAVWYELAGSEYYTRERHNFTITYHRPTAESGAHSLPYSTYDEYLPWECSWTDADGTPRDSTGWHMKNSFHSQSYWPAWIDADQLTFSGGCLPCNAVNYGTDENPYWVLYRYSADAYGYADASLNTDDYSTFDLDWAVDNNGDPVQITHCNFIRVMSATLQLCSWLGETSTEVASFTDLHLTDNYDDNPIVITPRKRPTAIATIKAGSAHATQAYDLAGRRVHNMLPGHIYIIGGRKTLAH